eukprot:8056-Amphidinium_carterae.2
MGAWGAFTVPDEVHDALGTNVNVLCKVLKDVAKSVAEAMHGAWCSLAVGYPREKHFEVHPNKVSVPHGAFTHLFGTG